MDGVCWCGGVVCLVCLVWWVGLCGWGDVWLVCSGVVWWGCVVDVSSVVGLCLELFG